MSREAATLRGVVDVQLAIRDPEITRVSCRVLQWPVNATPGEAPYQPVAGAVSGPLAIDPVMQPLGVVWDPAPPVSPVCVFADLPAGNLLLEVTGEKANGAQIVVTQPFEYER
jgi:hypothetical protein